MHKTDRLPKRFLLYGLVCCLLMAMAGCGPSAPTAPTTSRAPADPGVLNPPGTLPVVRRADTLRVFVSRQAMVTSYAYGQNALTTWLQDRTGVALEILLPAGDAAETFRARLFSGGDLGDLVLLRQTYAELARYGQSGLILPLENLIETYGHHFLAMLDRFSDTRPAVTAPDGHLYAFPQGNLVGLNPSALGMRVWVHRDFIARFGKGMPETTADFADYLRWVRDEDANGDGRLDDEIPWTGSDNRSVGYARPTDFLMNAFTLQDANGYYLRDGRIRCAMVEDGWREGLRYLRGLFAEGLMDINYATNDLYGLMSLVALGDGNTVGAISISNIASATPDPEIQARYVPLPPLRGPDGLRYAFYDHAGAGLSPGKAMIPATGARKELATAWMDACCDQETALRAELGAEGVDWERPPAGSVAADGGPALYRLLNVVGTTSTAQTWLGDSPALWNRSGPLGAVAKPAGTYDLMATLYQAARQYEPYALACSVPRMYLGQVAPEYDDWEMMVTMETAQAAAEFIYGIRDIHADTEWEDYLRQVRQAGLEPYLEARQQAFDRTWAEIWPQTYHSPSARLPSDTAAS